MWEHGRVPEYRRGDREHAFVNVVFLFPAIHEFMHKKIHTLPNVAKRSGQKCCVPDEAQNYSTRIARVQK